MVEKIKRYIIYFTSGLSGLVVAESGFRGLIFGGRKIFVGKRYGKHYNDN